MNSGSLKNLSWEKCLKEWVDVYVPFMDHSLVVVKGLA